MSETNLQALYARHRRALFTLALARTGHRERAEDAVHDAFVRLCRHGLNGAADPVAYVFAAVHNAALDQARRMRTLARAQPADSIYDAGPAEPQRAALAAERQRAVAAAVDSLSPEQREAIVLRIYAGLSFEQIAQVVGAPLQTVATRYRRGLHRLRGRLEKLV